MASVGVTEGLIYFQSSTRALRSAITMSYAISGGGGWLVGVSHCRNQNEGERDTKTDYWECRYILSVLPASFSGSTDSIEFQLQHNFLPSSEAPMLQDNLSFKPYCPTCWVLDHVLVYDLSQRSCHDLINPKILHTKHYPSTPWCPLQRSC